MITNRTLLLALASYLCFLVGANANDIEEGKEFYTAVRAQNPIVLDGDLSEWTGANVIADPRFWNPKATVANPNPVQELVNFELLGGNWTGPDDHTSAVRVVYDEENVYFGFVVTDEYHENAANSAWNGDSVQLMVADNTREIQVALYNYALGGVEGALGELIVNHEAGPAVDDPDVATEAVVIRNAETKRTTYEIRLPKGSLGLDELTGGVQFGLGMAINDGDETTPGQKGWGGLGAHSIVHGKTPSETALVTLFAPPVFPQNNDIEQGKEFYTAVKSANPIVLDGKLDEWSGAQVIADPRFWNPKATAANPNPVQELVNFELLGGNWTGPDDHTSAVRVVYDDDNVYFGFVVTDEYHENAANSAWNGDSVQLMIADKTREAQVALYNYALGGVEGALSEIIVNHEAGPAAGDPDAATEAVVIRDPDTQRTTYEIKLPKAALDLDELTGGVQFGLGMAINDGDEATPGQKGWGGLGAHSIVHGKTPTETALVTLATANDIESGKEYYFASPVTSPIALDGELSDWRGVGILSDPRFWNPKATVANPNPVQELVNFELLGGDWTGPDDHTSAVQITFDLENVYFAFVVTDEYHENAANSAWNGDSVQLMIANEKQDTQVALYNYALGGVEGALGDIIVNHEAGPAVGDPDAATEAIVKRNAETKRTTYEIKLPKGALGLEELTLGTMFGLGMAINDGDEATPGQKGWGGLGAHSIVHGKTPSETALVTFGIGGAGSSPCFLSAISSPSIAALDKFTFRANDFEGCEVDPASVTLTVDGQLVGLVASEKKNGATDFTYTLAEPFETGSEHTFTIELKDASGTVVTTETSSFVAPTYGILTPDMRAKQVNRTKPGFLWRVFQNDIYAPNSLADLELALAGTLVDGNGDPITENFADKSLIGPATGEGIVVGPKGNLLEFEIPTVIDLSTVEGGGSGNFLDDFQTPGVPGVNFISAGADAEIIAYVEFPAGITTMGVNSDDSFRADSGFIGIPEQRERLGEFNGGRGPADSIFIVSVREAGIYPLRVIWQNGGGEGAIEIFTVKADGSKVLLNDTANGGLRTYSSSGADTFNITQIAFDAQGNLVVEWNSRPGVDYAIDASPILATPPAEWQELDDGIASDGASTRSTISAATLSGTSVMYLRVREL